MKTPNILLRKPVIDHNTDFIFGGCDLHLPEVVPGVYMSDEGTIPLFVIKDDEGNLTLIDQDIGRISPFDGSGTWSTRTFYYAPVQSLKINFK